MKYDFKTQSLACKEAKHFLETIQMWPTPELPEQLECAAQTLAALNWTKHLPDEGRDEYIDKLISNLCDIVSITRERANVSNIRDLVEKETNLKKEILAMSYDVIQSQSSELKEKEKRIAKLEKGLRDSIKLISSLEYAGEPVSENNYKEFESLLNKTN